MNLQGSKAKNVRQVTVLENFFSKGKKDADGKVISAPKLILKKGSVHAMHQTVAARLKEKGAKIEVKIIDLEKMTRIRKAELEEA